MQLQKAAELRNEADKVKKKLANMSKTNSTVTSVCNGDSKSKSGSKSKTNKASADRKIRSDKHLRKKEKKSKSHRSRSHEKPDTYKEERKKDKIRSKDRERKNKRNDDKYFEEQEIRSKSTTGKNSHYVGNIKSLNVMLRQHCAHIKKEF